MKKLLYCAAAFATLLFAASCQQEELAPAVDNSTVTFTVEAPAAFQTKAIADGQNVDQLVYEVWLTETLGDLTKGAEKLYQATADMVSDGNVNKATLTLDLVKDQKFTVLFWAQVESSAAYNTEELTAVTYAKDAYDSNDEGLAAFYSVAYVDDNKHVTKEGNATTGTVVLRRPFAQLNLGTLNTAVYDVKVLKSEVTVSDVNTVFNVATSVASEAKSMTFDMAEVPADPSTITVNGVEYVYVAMNYVFASDNATVSYDLETSIKGNTTNVTNEVTSVPLKENYRTNIIGNLLTGNTDFDIIVDEGFAGDENKDANTDYVTNDVELAAALKQDKRDIIIDLAQEEVTKATTPKTYNVTIGAWTETYYFGGETTRTITINANGNTINFVHENSDWNYIRCVNDAVVWTINDAALTNSGENDGPWNRHDIRFYNSVVLNDVTSDKAIALLNDGKLNNVTITEATEAYGLWITAEGQTVDINGLNITATNGGRGIAIKDQYVESPACVTLNVADATFETAKKAAVLVTSTAGAVITLQDVDITNVAADSDFSVWVDEDRAEYADKVVVTGGLCKVEGSTSAVIVRAPEELATAITDGASTVYLAEGEYVIPSAAKGKTISFVGTGNPEDVSVAVTKVGTGGENCDYGLDGSTVTFENITITTNSSTYIGYARCNGTYKNCVINGTYTLYGDSVFEDCTFNVSGDVYNIWTWGAPTATFTGCTFNSDGKAMLLYGTVNTELTINDCIFNDNGGLADLKAAIEIGNDYGKSYKLVVNNTVVNGYEINDKGINTGTTLWANKNSMSPENLSVTIDGLVWVGGLLYEDAEGNVIVDSEEALKAALETGGTIVLANPFTIDQSESNGYGKTGINMTNGGTLDGNGNELGAPGSTGTWDSAINTSGGTIKNIKITQGFRGIFIKNDSEHNEKLYLDNVTIDGTTYTISCDSGNGLGLEAINSTFKGWTSFAATLGNAKFVDCYFGAGNGYSYCRPYAPTEFIGCAFEAGFEVDPRAAVTFENCTLDGVALTADNLATLVTSNIANATVK